MKLNVCACLFSWREGVPPLLAKAPSQNVICPNNTNVIDHNKCHFRC